MEFKIAGKIAKGGLKDKLSYSSLVHINGDKGSNLSTQPSSPPQRHAWKQEQLNSLQPLQGREYFWHLTQTV